MQMAVELAYSYLGIIPCRLEVTGHHAGELLARADLYSSSKVTKHCIVLQSIVN